MIRLATIEDIPRLVELGRRFRRETTYERYIAENPEKMAELGKKLIEQDGLLLAEEESGIVGMLGYVVYEHFISGETIAGEIFWWVEPEHRGSGVILLQEAENRAKSRGAKHFQMIAPNERVGKFYERRKFSWVEATYQKNL